MVYTRHLDCLIVLCLSALDFWDCLDNYRVQVCGMELCVGSKWVMGVYTHNLDCNRVMPLSS